MRFYDPIKADDYVNTTKLERQLFTDEGLRLKPYLCTAGKVTIGVGRNLEDRGISKDEAILMLRNDIASVRAECEQLSWFDGLNQPRKDAVINMVFNLGLTRFKEFKNTIAHLERGEFTAASGEMLRSKWAAQVGDRAKRLAAMIRTGEYPK